ncbi:hypothetical protein ACLM5H_15660 [Fredinandcohnia humi]
MRNTLGDLNNHLFAQLERLSDEELTGEKLDEEIKRARSINDVAKRIISNGTLVLQAQKFQTEYKSKDLHKPKMLEG